MPLHELDVGRRGADLGEIARRFGADDLAGLAGSARLDDRRPPGSLARAARAAGSEDEDGQQDSGRVALESEHRSETGTLTPAAVKCQAAGAGDSA